MPRNKFGQAFLQGFQNSFNPTFQNVLSNLQQEERQRKIMDEQNRRVEEERMLEAQQRQMATDLVKGGETLDIPVGLSRFLPTGIKGFNQYTPEQIVNQLGRLDKTGKDTYDFLIQSITPPKPEKQPTISIGGGLKGYKLNPLINQLEVDEDNWIVEPSKKILTTTEGYAPSGEKVKLIRYTDGSEERINTGFYKAPKSNGQNNTEQFNLNLYRTNTNKRESAYNAIVKQMNDYPEMMQTLNDKMNQEESVFYNTMLPTARKYIDMNYYDTLKSKGLPEGFEYSERQGISKDFIKNVTEDYKDGKLSEGNFKIDFSQYPKPKGITQEEWERQIEAETYKSILLWTKLKFNRL